MTLIVVIHLWHLQQLHKQDKLKLRVLKNLPVELLDQAYELGLGAGFRR